MDCIRTHKGLSYTWGLVRSSEDISLNNYFMPVTKNLWEVHGAFRLIAHPCKLWVDTICINVNIMRHILQRKRVVWIGPQADDSDLGFDFLPKLSKIPKKYFDFAPCSVLF